MSLHLPFSEWALGQLESICLDPIGTLDSFLDGENAGENAARSYPHANGFVKLHLGACGPPGCKLLLHYWPAGSSTATSEHIHDHRWPLATWIAYGSYRLETFSLASDGERYNVYKYESADEKPAFELTPYGDERLRQDFDGFVGRGTRFFQDSRAIHRVSRVDSEPILTFFLQGSAEKDSTNVFAPSPIRQAGTVPIKRLSVEHWRGLIDDAMRLLGG